MSQFDDFVARLEAALACGEGRAAFAAYLQQLTPEEQAEMVAEAERRDTEGAAELAGQVLAPTKEGGARKAREGKAPKPASRKRGGQR